jgi:hypothetical protein
MTKPLLGRIALGLSILMLSTVSFAKEVKATAEAKDWTVLVFLNGHNSLDSFGKMNIDQMSQVGSSDKVNVVVQWASEINGNTKRLFVKKGGYDVVQDMKPVNMGDYKNLIEFVRWGQANYPAKKYMIDVWNHGNGWHMQEMGQIHTNDISYDDIFHSQITTEQLGLAMAESAKITGHKVELYASDACMMAMGEVAAELSDSVKFFGGSQETEPGEGWPYSTFLARLIAKPTMDGGELASALSQEYKAAYSGGLYGNKEVTFSAWDLSKIDAFYGAVKNLATELKALDPQSLKAAFNVIGQAQSFAVFDYKDLSDYVTLVDQSNLRLSTHAVADVATSMNQMLLSVDVTPYYARAHGVSVWLPTYQDDWTRYGSRYLKLNFNKKTGWGDFLSTVLKNAPPY